MSPDRENIAATVAVPIAVVLKVLTTSNYEDWSFRVKTYLLGKDLWKVVESAVEPPRVEDGEAEYEAWSKKNEEALHAIHISCGDDTFSFIRGIDTAAAAWNTLEKKLKRAVRLPDGISEHQSTVDGELQLKDLKPEPIVRWSYSMASQQAVPNSIVNELLMKENYDTWSIGVETYLIAKGLWEIVSDDTEPQLKGKEKRDAWQKLNAKALHAIHICCGNEAFIFIKDIKSANKAWEALKNYAAVDEVKDKPEKEEGAVESQEKVDQEDGDGDGRGDETVDYKPLFRAVKHSRWDSVLDFIEKHPEAVGVKSLAEDGGKTVLHSSIDALRVDIVVKLLPYIKDVEVFDRQDGDDYSALEYCYTSADSDEMVQIAELLIQKKEELEELVDDPDSAPDSFDLPDLLVQATVYGRHKMAKYLYGVTKDKLDDSTAATLISQSFRTKRFGIACDLIKRNPMLAVTGDVLFDHRSPLNELVCTPSAFFSGCESELKFWQKWIYRVIVCIKPVPPIKNESMDKDGKGKPTSVARDAISIDVNPTQGYDKFNYMQGGLIRSVMAFFQGPIIKSFRNLFDFGISRVYKMRLHHDRCLEILSCMCEVLTPNEIKNFTDEQMNFVDTAIVQAAERGLVEFLTHVLKANPNLVKTEDEKGRNLFQVAVKCRQGKVFSLIYALTKETQKDIMGSVDNDSNNMLHMMGLFSPFAQTNRIRGAALQMQNELQWFQELEDMARPEYLEEINDTHDMKPREFFSKNHIEMVKEGEKSMKETANSCTVVCALIVTIMFAAAFTVPGGNKDDGYPILFTRRAFQIFKVADAVSLVSSTTSVMLFLGILTSRYAEEDFLVSLPRIMIWGLLTLFISMTAMMVAFASALILILPKDVWEVIPTNLVAAIPIATFIWMQFPYLLEIFRSTYMPGTFVKKVDLNLGKIRFV